MDKMNCGLYPFHTCVTDMVELTETDNPLSRMVWAIVLNSGICVSSANLIQRWNTILVSKEMQVQMLPCILY